MAFMKEAEQHLLLGKPQGIPVKCPVRILHALTDTQVPCDIPMAVIQQLQAEDARLVLVKVRSMPSF